MTTASDPLTAERPAHWRTRLGRTEQRGDLITVASLNAWATTLDRDQHRLGLMV